MIKAAFLFRVGVGVGLGEQQILILPLHLQVVTPYWLNQVPLHNGGSLPGHDEPPRSRQKEQRSGHFHPTGGLNISCRVTRRRFKSVL